ncbi:MAG: hypothetical protein ABI644_09090 [Arenimonas sp.]
MFKGLGILVAIYTIYAISQGEVFAKSGVWGNTISKTESPKYFWAVIAVYSLLSIALITVF